MGAKPYTVRYLTKVALQAMQREAMQTGLDQWRTWDTRRFPSKSAAKRWLRQHQPAAVSDNKPLPWTNNPPQAGAVAAP